MNEADPAIKKFLVVISKIDVTDGLGFVRILIAVFVCDGKCGKTGFSFHQIENSVVWTGGATVG